VSLAHRCDSCGQVIQQEQFLELAVRVLKIDEDADQDAVEEHHADYCNDCVNNGAAVGDLLLALEKYRPHGPAAGES
jgi:hypothetical protein